MIREGGLGRRERGGEEFLRSEKRKRLDYDD